MYILQTPLDPSLKLATEVIVKSSIFIIIDKIYVENFSKF